MVAREESYDYYRTALSAAAPMRSQGRLVRARQGAVEKARRRKPRARRATGSEPKQGPTGSGQSLLFDEVAVRPRSRLRGLDLVGGRSALPGLGRLEDQAAQERQPG